MVTTARTRLCRHDDDPNVCPPCQTAAGLPAAATDDGRRDRGPIGDLGKCRSCERPIRWVITTRGKKMPLDPDPSPHGNVLVEDGLATVLGPLEAQLELAGGEDLYVTHFTTCPHADSWRAA